MTKKQTGPAAWDAAEWLEGLSAGDLRRLLAEAVVRVDGMAEFVARARIAEHDDIAAMDDEVRATFTPTRRFYEYRAANAYAHEAEPVVQLLIDRATNAPSAELLSVLQRAIDLEVRAILRSDDSAGMHGNQVRRLLDAHAQAAATLTLPRAQAKKLVKWLFTFRFGGKQDFFEVDIDRYATAVGPAGIDEYRKMVDATAANEPDSFAVGYARGRLAILSRDADQIIAHFGRDLVSAGQYSRLVAALDDAAHGDLAVEYARRGIEADPRSHYVTPLVTRVVDDARQRNDYDDALQILRSHFRAASSAATYSALKRTATDAGVWGAESRDAGERLAEANSRAWVQVLDEQGDDDAAWRAAEEHPDHIDDTTWKTLIEKRVKTDPASTLSHYRRMTETTLATADRRNYRAATRLLREMRAAAEAAGRSPEFDDYLADVADRNRHRPSFGQESRRAGLTE